MLIEATLQVIPNVGLCISLLDILSTTEGAVMYGDGCLYYRSAPPPLPFSCTCTY